MNKNIGIIAALIAASFSAHATDVFVNGAPSKLHLQSIEVVGGSVKSINLSETVSIPVVPAPVKPPVAPVSKPETPVSSANCGQPAANVKVVDIGTLGNQFKQTLFTPRSPDEIIAFKIVVPASGQIAADFRATKTSASSLTKMVTVSACPGDYTNVVNSGGRACTKFSTESSRIYLTSDQSANQRSWCILQPGQTYYINAVAKQSLESNQLTCSDGPTCTFFAASGAQ